MQNNIKNHTHPQGTRLEAETLLAGSHNSDDRGRAYLILGILHEQQEEWQLAIESYRKCLAEEPSEPDSRYLANNNLAFSLIKTGRYDDAALYCITAILVYYDHHLAHTNLGIIYQEQGRTFDAAFSFLTAACLQPTDDRALECLKRLLANRPDLLIKSETLKKGVSDLMQKIEKLAC